MIMQVQDYNGYNAAEAVPLLNYWALLDIKMDVALIRFYLPSRKTVFCIGLMTGLILALAPVFYKIDSIVSAQTSIYGQALANAAARESVEAAFQHDSISLGAVMQTAVTNPSVLQASLYNVENQLVVQAGASPHELPQDIQFFVAQIALHDSIAGSISLTLETRSWGKVVYLSFYFCLALLCFAFTAWRLFIERCIVWQPRPKKEPLPANENSTDSIDEAEETEADIKQPEPEKVEAQCSAHVALCVKNIGVLQKQLNGESFRQTFAKLERLIENIGLLYGLTQVEWIRDRYLVRFSSNNLDDALFNAACAASLMLDLAGVTNRVPLDLSAQVAYAKDPLIDVEMPFVGLALSQLEGESEQLKPKVNCIDLSDEDTSRQLISAFNPPYDELLQKQIAQFKH